MHVEGEAMRLIHNSRLPEFRTPFGAVSVGTNVTLSVRVEEADPASVGVSLRTWVDGVGEAFLPLERQGQTNVFSVELPCEAPQLTWYSFIATTGDGQTAYLGAPWGRVGGEGIMYTEKEPPSFQLTIYKPRATRPNWYENGIVYQIFPDRYRRDEHWHERTEEAISHRHEGIRWRLVEDWDEPPTYDRNPDGSIRTWDFYGGSLKGIEGDLPRLADLGITVIYLNPIFEAASNHRYDTSDYLKIDPVLGTEEDFRHLCAEAKKRGISIILDGVFNHTGDDSVYFNRYGNYPDVGAWQSPESPWRDAYRFHEDGTYDCWWGISNMPALNEDSPKVKELILGEHGVVRTWLRAGARGWRLDVADELKEEMIAGIKQATLEERPDGVVIGEVWEDASNKVSYGHLRHYLLGDELDSAMNYPFRDMVLGFLLGTKDAAEAVEDIESLSENYPAEALNCALNLLGSHDRPRIASVLGGGPDESKLPESERGRWRLDAASMGLAKGRFWLATLMQMTFPGVPSIYYGDEFCLEGLSDPGNRRTLPLLKDIRDSDMQTIIKNAAGVRRALPFLGRGSIRAFVPEGSEGDVLAYTRRDEETGEAATVLINRSNASGHTVRIPALGDAATDVVSGHELPILPARSGEGSEVEVGLYGFGSAVVYFHAQQRLQRPLDFGAGTVCHITSVPTDDGRPGTLGAPARRFVDHLAAMGLTYWQVLPVNPTDSFGSPYAGPSAFAGNVALLPESENELRAEFARTAGARSGLLGQSRATDPAFERFLTANGSWVRPFAAYMAIKRVQGNRPWQEWPADLRRYSPALFDAPSFADEARFQAWCQYRFEVAWRELAAYAHERGVKIIGDIPMYVSEDSADAWASPELFWLDERGRTLEGAGAPPDNLAPEGQLWGNPTYRWDVMREQGYAWWIARLRRACDLYDVVRLDHFLGFHNYFSVPAGHPCSDGRWLAGPGRDLFSAVHRELGDLPFIAEDLGILTPGVRALGASCGFPGMDVLQFDDYDVRQGVDPHPEKILYTGTHDTATLLGWCTASFTGGDVEAAHQVADELTAAALNSDANLVMLPLQDILRLGEESRMNVPGTAEGNWRWQASEGDVAAAEPRFAELMTAAGRATAAAAAVKTAKGAAAGAAQA